MGTENRTWSLASSVSKSLVAANLHLRPSPQQHSSRFSSRRGVEEDISLSLSLSFPPIGEGGEEEETWEGDGWGPSVERLAKVVVCMYSFLEPTQVR